MSHSHGMWLPCGRVLTSFQGSKFVLFWEIRAHLHSRTQSATALRHKLLCPPALPADVDLCAGKECAAPGECQKSNCCNPRTGKCTYDNLPNDSPCPDGKCKGGSCKKGMQSRGMHQAIQTPARWHHGMVVGGLAGVMFLGSGTKVPFIHCVWNAVRFEYILRPPQRILVSLMVSDTRWISVGNLKT